MLEELGLPAAQEGAYRELLGLARAPATVVASRLGISASAARGLLTALVAAGLAAAEPAEPDGRPVFRPLPPDAALGAVLARRAQSLETCRELVAQLTEEYHASTRRRDADQLVEIVDGRASLRQRLRYLQETAQYETRWFCRANHLAMSSEENLEEFAALGRGVQYRVVYERALLAAPGMAANVAAGIRRGEQARVLPALPVRLAIIDRTVAACPLVPEVDSGEPTAALVGPGQLLDALLALFDSYWEQALPIAASGAAEEVADAPTGELPDEQSQVLLSLFVAGLPDKAIASQLNVSRRTVQRRIAELMARAGVDTRPGLAFQAARRNWL